MKKNTVSIHLLALAALQLGLNTNTAIAADAVAGARAALDKFLVAWNTGELAEVRRVVNYPNVSHMPGRVVVAEDGLFAQDFDRLRETGWVRSSFDQFNPVQVSEDKVNFTVEWSRYNASGEAFIQGAVFYIVTKQNGHWGMQYRGPAAREGQINESVVAQVERDSMAAVEDFFEGFNAADNTALSSVQHVPQAMLSQGNFIHAQNPSSPLVNYNFAGMRQREDWNRSTIAEIEAVNVMPNRVYYQLTFERYDSNGEKYRTVPALWVLTKKNGNWGVEFRSLMTPTFNR